MVPLRVLSEGLGLAVKWDASTRTVILDYLHYEREAAMPPPFHDPDAQESSYHPPNFTIKEG